MFWTPFHIYLLSTVLLQVSLGRLLFLFPSGAHVSAVLGNESGFVLNTCPILLHLRVFICVLILSDLVLSLFHLLLSLANGFSEFFVNICVGSCPVCPHPFSSCARSRCHKQHKQFVNDLNCNSKIAKQQSGNRQFHSTETALLHFTDEILKNMDEKKVSLVVLLDMSKAFDSIKHELLLSKLRKIGVSTSAHKWFKSYLIDRGQVVKIYKRKDTTSKALPLESECPKGPYLALFCLPSTLTTCHKYQDIFLAFQPCEILKAIQLLNLDLLKELGGVVFNSLLVNPD